MPTPSLNRARLQRLMADLSTEMRRYLVFLLRCGKRAWLWDASELLERGLVQQVTELRVHDRRLPVLELTRDGFWCAVCACVELVVFGDDLVDQLDEALLAARRHVVQGYEPPRDQRVPGPAPFIDASIDDEVEAANRIELHPALWMLGDAMAVLSLMAQQLEAEEQNFAAQNLLLREPIATMVRISRDYLASECGVGFPRRCPSCGGGDIQVENPKWRCGDCLYEKTLGDLGSKPT